jgi:excisionase family DNA binding protein
MALPERAILRSAPAAPNGGSARPGPDTPPAAHVDLLTVAEAAALLRVSDATIRNWIAAERVPYIQLPRPGRGDQYRIPLQGLLGSLEGNFDLRGALQEQNARMRLADLTED